MEFKKKIAAFTLTEVLVVIVVSAIVVGLALSVLNLVQQNFYSIRKNFQATTDNQLLKQRLLIDFNRYHTISYNESTGLIMFKNPIDSVLYKYADFRLIRDLDTLGNNIKDLTFYYEGAEVKQGQIDASKLFLGADGSEIIFVSKVNAATNAFYK